MPLFAFVKRRRQPALQPTPAPEAQAPQAEPEVATSAAPEPAPEVAREVATSPSAPETRDDLIRTAAWALAVLATDAATGEPADVALRLLTERALYLVASLGEDLAVLSLQHAARRRRLDAHARTCRHCVKHQRCPTFAAIRREIGALDRQLDSGRRYLASMP